MSVRLDVGGWSAAGAADRLRIPHQDGAGTARGACARAGVPGRRAHPPAGPASCSCSARSVGDGGLGRLVHRAGGAVACGRQAVHRRVDDELAAGARAGLQRHRSAARRQRHGGGGGGGGGETAAFGGAAGITRLFLDEIGLEISWLLPATLILLVAGIGDLPARASGPTGCARRCCSGAAGRWSPDLVFSFMSGTMHPYYTVALAPGIAAIGRSRRGDALAGSGGGSVVARAALALATAGDRRMELSCCWRGSGGVVRVDPLDHRWPSPPSRSPASCSTAGRMRPAGTSAGMVAAILVGSIGAGRVRRRHRPSAGQPTDRPWIAPHPR